MIHIGIVLEHAGQKQDLDLDVDESAPGTSIYELVSRRLQLRLGSFWLQRVDVGDQLVPGRTIGQHRLLHGECLRVVPGEAPPATSVERAVLVTIVAGPHAGESATFAAGSFGIGRRATPGGLTLDRDDQCSGRHATVRMTPAGVEIEDLGSTNGTLLDGQPIAGAVVLRDGQEVLIGRSLVRFHIRAGLHDAAHVRYAQGRLLLNRPARIQRRRPSEVVDIPKPPDSPSPRRLPKAMIIGPALLGIPSFLITKSPLALIMVLGSPLLAVFSWLDDRTSGRKDFGKKSIEYTARLDQIASEIDEANRRSAAWRSERNPGVDEVLDRATRRSPELWQRDNNDGDFLEVRVGRASLPSLVAVKVPGDGDEKLRGEIATRARPQRYDDGAPVVVPLGQAADPANRAATAADVVDVVAVVGNPRSTDPLVRWIVCQLAVHQSPQDLALAVAVPSRGADWAWTHWLPHVEQITSDDELPAMVATNDSHAGRLLKNVTDLAANRIEASRDAYAPDTRFQPHLCLVAELPVRAAPSDFTAFLEQLPTANMSTVLVAHDRRMVPRQADVIITVSDDGPGIPSSKFGEVLQRGGRLDTSGGGSGLGLAIVSDIAEAWGGVVELGNSGGLFNVHLRLPRASSAPTI